MGHDWNETQSSNILECILDASDKDVSECHKNVTSWRKVTGAIRSLVSVRDLQLSMRGC